MIIKKDNMFPLIKVKTPTGIDFFKEHKSIIDSYGYVWFCRFGKNNMKYDTVASCNPILFIKNSGISNGGIYIARYEAIENSITENGTVYPHYYQDIQQSPAMWFKIYEMNPMDYDVLIESFVGASSGGDINRILKSMCPAFFIRSTQDIEI